MRELALQYEGKIKLTVVAPDEKELIAELKELNTNHGLIAWAADGTVKDKVPGHDFGKDRILEAIQKVLPQ